MLISRKSAFQSLAYCLFCSSGGPFPSSPCRTFSSVHLLASNRHFSMTNSRQCSNSSSRNHYQILGLPGHASQAEIKDAFYRLSKKYHPDVSGLDGEESAQKFLELREAYETLRDEQMRRDYDQQQRHQFGSNATSQAERRANFASRTPRTRPERSPFSGFTDLNSTRAQQREDEEMDREEQEAWWEEYRQREAQFAHERSQAMVNFLREYSPHIGLVAIVILITAYEAYS